MFPEKPLQIDSEGSDSDDQMNQVMVTGENSTLFKKGRSKSKKKSLKQKEKEERQK